MSCKRSTFILAGVLASASLFASRAPARHFACPAEMRDIDGRFCIDPYEESTVELSDDGSMREHSPFEAVTHRRVRAVSRKGVAPQGYINRDESEAACNAAGKRLCSNDEWVLACKGAERTRYPYGPDRKPNVCVDTGRVAPLLQVFGNRRSDLYHFEPMNDPRLNQVPGTLAPTGTFADCTNSFEVYDMVGNLHEWTSDKSGTFRGGYYLDTKINGEGCDYRTVAHAASYHDYSTGFRCCWSPEVPNQ